VALYQIYDIIHVSNALTNTTYVKHLRSSGVDKTTMNGGVWRAPQHTRTAVRFHLP
jgi:hypothetical protein